MGVDDERVVVVGNGVDTRDLLAGRRAGRRGGPYFVYAGTMSEWQGVDVFVRALAAVRADHPDAAGWSSSARAATRPTCAPWPREVAPGAVDFLGVVPPEECARWMRGRRAGLVSIKPGHRLRLRQAHQGLRRDRLRHPGDLRRPRRQATTWSGRGARLVGRPRRDGGRRGDGRGADRSRLAGRRARADLVRWTARERLAGRGLPGGGRRRARPRAAERSGPSLGQARSALGDALGGVPVAVRRRVGRRRSAAPSRPRQTSDGSLHSTFQPRSTVSVHSVSVRTVVQGTRSRKASFCRPPESVTTPARAATSADQLGVGQRVGDHDRAARPARCRARPRRRAAAGARAAGRAGRGRRARRRSRRSRSGSSVFSAPVDASRRSSRWRRPRRRRSARWSRDRASRTGRQTSVITSPTSRLRAARPSSARCPIATSVGARHRSAAWSVSTRLCSSGIRRLNERSPASRWATGRCSFTAASGAGERGVGVAVDQHPVRALLLEHRRPAPRASRRSARRGCRSRRRGGRPARGCQVGEEHVRDMLRRSAGRCAR